MIAARKSTKKVWTEEELQALPDNGYIHELVDGELIMSPKNNFQHEDICADLLMAMRAFAKAHHLGAVLGGSAGFWMYSRNCRAPDISFITRDRLLSLGFKRSTRKFFPGAPDLAVEVLSPSNTRTDIDARLQDFFTSGTQLAWIINPDTEQVEVCSSPTKRRLLGMGADLDGEHLLPGFRYPLADLFKEWDWDQ
jgi:Uma2 family endonuclease